jgi:hypothetical protein
MGYRMRLCILILTILTPFSSLAEHDCLEEAWKVGHWIKIEKDFPKNWLMIGDKLIYDPQLHSILRSEFAKYYTEGTDGEGFSIDHFCGYKNGIYVTISNGDFGPSAEFSSKAPKCWKCKPVTESIKYFVSGSVLKIGQDKARVTSILGYTIKEDRTCIKFEEIEKGKEHKIYHSQYLWMEFRNNKLIRFAIDDFRERYD